MVNHPSLPTTIQAKPLLRRRWSLAGRDVLPPAFLGAPLGDVFGTPSTTPRPARLAALGLQRAQAEGPPVQNRCSRFRNPLSLTLPPSSKGLILAPRALFPKRTPLDLPCASWLAVYGRGIGSMPKGWLYNWVGMARRRKQNLDTFRRKLLGCLPVS
jgi:hypothetical protein